MILAVISMFIVSCVGNDGIYRSDAGSNIASSEFEFKGHFDAVESCPFKLVVDVLSDLSRTPILIPEVDKEGHFSFVLPDQYRHSPLRVNGFCYETLKDFHNNNSAWKTDELLLLPGTDSTESLILTRSMYQERIVEVENNRLTEWGILASDPFWSDFYGLHTPDHEQTTPGSLPERLSGHLTRETHSTYLWSLYALIQSITTREQQGLLLPTRQQMAALANESDQTVTQVAILKAQLHYACEALNIVCPSDHLLRQQEWVPKDKTFVSSSQTVELATIWLLSNHLATEARKEGLDPREFLSLPLETVHSVETNQTAQINQIVDNLRKGYQHFGMDIPEWGKKWIRERMPVE